MNELQALVTGMLIGSLMRQDQVDLTIEPQYDDDRNYLSEFVVTGNVTGTKLRVKVELEWGAPTTIEELRAEVFKNARDVEEQPDLSWKLVDNS